MKISINGAAAVDVKQAVNDYFATQAPLKTANALGRLLQYLYVRGEVTELEIYDIITGRGGLDTIVFSELPNRGTIPP